MKYSLLLPVSPTRPEQAVPFANLVEWTRAERLWQGQSLVLDSHHIASWLAGIGIRVPCGFGVSLMPLRSPYQAAIEARSAALATGHPVIAGFGPGGLQAQVGFTGHRYSSQIDACEEYVRIVRGLLSGEPVVAEGTHFSTQAQLVESLSPQVDVGLGVLREKMAVLAGEIADRAITWMASASYVDQTLFPAIRGAKRELSDPLRVTAVVPVALADEERDMIQLAAASCGQHTRQPHYQDALDRAGIVVTGDGGRNDALKLIDGGVFLYGTAQEIHERLAEFAKAGVDEVVLNVTGVAQTHGPKAAARDLLTLLRDAPPENRARPLDAPRTETGSQADRGHRESETT